MEQDPRSHFLQRRKILNEQITINGVFLHISGFKFQHPADFFRFISTYIMVQSQDADIPHFLFRIAAQPGKYPGYDTGHPESVVHQPGIHIITGTADYSQHAPVVNIITIFNHIPHFLFWQKFHGRIPHRAPVQCHIPLRFLQSGCDPSHRMQDYIPLRPPAPCVPDTTSV